MGMTLPGESMLTCGRVSIRANRLQVIPPVRHNTAVQAMWSFLKRNTAR